MKTMILLCTIFFLVGLSLGNEVGARTQRQHDSKRILILSKRLERFENPTVFHHAEKVSRITHTPLYDIIAGGQQ